RRRHTRSKRDWSSDVCSSDLLIGQQLMCRLMSHLAGRRNGEGKNHRLQSFLLPKFQNPVHKQHMTAVKPVKLSQRNGASPLCFRSEERRVGQEGESAQTCVW